MRPEARRVHEQQVRGKAGLDAAERLPEPLRAGDGRRVECVRGLELRGVAVELSAEGRAAHLLEHAQAEVPGV